MTTQTGTNKTGANEMATNEMATNGAYLSAASARRFATSRNIDGFQGVTDAQLQQVLLRASEWLDHSFTFTGQPATPDQLRAFPRTGLPGASDTAEAILPLAVVQAVVELAAALLSSEGEAEQLLGLRGGIAREQLGDVVVSWRARRGPQGRLAQLLRPYLQAGQSGQTGSVRLHRS